MDLSKLPPILQREEDECRSKTDNRREARETTPHILEVRQAWFFVAMTAALCLTEVAAITNTYTFYITLDTVNITGFRDMGNIYVERSTPSYEAVIGSPYYGRVSMDREIYMEYVAFVADVVNNPATTPDVRCNIGAVQSTRTTTSHDSTTERFLAAQQLFAWIRGVDNAVSLRALTRNTADYLYNGAKQFTFQVTYADGGRERWVVGSILTGALIVEANVPNSLTLGDGTVQACPSTPKG